MNNQEPLKRMNANPGSGSLVNDAAYGKLKFALLQSTALECKL